MLSAVSMIQAVNENFNHEGLHESSVPAMSFVGLDAIQACSAGRAAVMYEAVCFREFAVQSDEILAEAVMTNPDAVDVLSENIFSNIAEKAKKVFDKIVAAVKALIQRIKAFFFKLTGKTDKWVKIMEVRVREARKTGNRRDGITYEMHDWDEAYISKSGGLVKAIESLVKTWETEYGKMKFSEIKSKIISTAQDAPKTADYDKEKDEYYQANKDSDDHADEIKTEAKEAFVKNLNTVFETNGSDEAEVYSAVRKKCMKDEESKTSRKIASSIDSMMATVKDSGKIKTDLEKTYNNYLKKLEKAKADLSKSVDFNIPNTKETSPTAIAEIRESFKKTLDAAVQITTMYHSAVSQAQQIQLSAHNEMIKEYMNAVTAYCNGKPSKTEE